MAEHDPLQLLNDAILGESDGQIMLHGPAECRHAARRLVEQARQKLFLFSFDLDAPIYDQEPFIEAVKHLAVRSPMSQVRILLQDNERVQKEGHRVVDLWRRLTSKIEIRRPHPDYIDHPENFLLVDETGYLRWDLYNRYEGRADFHARLDAGRYANFFQEVWERSEPDTELRRLHI